MRKIGSILIIAIFVIVVCFSWLLWIFLEKYVDATNYENRQSASAPKLTAENYLTFAEEYDAYFSDNIPFRNNLIRINSAIDYFLFDKSISDRVVLGKNRWLFYGDVTDGNPLGNYCGDGLFSEDEMAEIASNLVCQRDYLLSKGKEFIVFIAPNKERVYCEEMPDEYGKPAEMYRAKQIVDYLKDNTDLRVVYPYEELMNVKQMVDENIYYRTDTHWNYIGGYVGASALMRELGIVMPSIDECKIVYGDKYAGDLSGMLNLSKYLKNDIEYTIKGYDEHEMQILDEDFNTVYAYNAVNADPRKIYVCRDSFSTAMRFYIGSQFSESYLRNRNTYSYDDFVQQDPDIFVYECVERYVGNLKNLSIQ